MTDRLIHVVEIDGAPVYAEIYESNALERLRYFRAAMPDKRVEVVVYRGPEVSAAVQQDCPACEGLGQTDDRGWALRGQPYLMAITCVACRGAGKIAGEGPSAPGIPGVGR